MFVPREHNYTPTSKVPRAEHPMQRFSASRGEKNEVLAATWICRGQLSIKTWMADVRINRKWDIQYGGLLPGSTYISLLGDFIWKKSQRIYGYCLDPAIHWDWIEYFTTEPTGRGKSKMVAAKTERHTLAYSVEINVEMQCRTRNIETTFYSKFA